MFPGVFQYIFSLHLFFSLYALTLKVPSKILANDIQIIIFFLFFIENVLTFHESFADNSKEKKQQDLLSMKNNKTKK